MSKSISTRYTVGGKCSFTSSWQGKNIVLPDSKLYFMLDGEIYLKIGDEEFIAKRGDLILIPQNTVHSCSLTDLKYMKKAWCHFSVTRDGAEFFEGFSMPYIIRVNDVELMENMFDRLFSASASGEVGSELMLSARLHDIICYYLSHCELISRKAGHDGIDACLEYMQKNYATITDVNSLAKIANYSLNHFIKKFKRKTGTTPMKLLTQIKIDAARSLLQHSSDSINEVMEKTGFLDTSHFIKLFKKHIGYTPKRFSELYRINQSLL